MKTIVKSKLLVLMFLGNFLNSSAQDVERVILFMIDGLHWQAPEKMNMPNFNKLINEGTYINKSYVIMPHHPTIGDYSKFNSCSFPNPMLHSGTVFIKPENKMIQEMISPDRQTAFVVNTMAYRSVARGFTSQIMDPTLTDNDVLKQGISLLKNQDPVFMRIHLQSPGELGRSVSVCDPAKPYFRNIYGQGSPYVKAIEHADKLLGKLVFFLKESGKWEDTILIVSSDHGQSKVGWHPMYDEESWVTPMVFAGKGIAEKRELAYFEHTDLAPTIAKLLGVEKPNKDGGSGNAVLDILEKNNVTENAHPQYIKIINEQIVAFNRYKSSLILASESNPYYAVVLASLENEFLTPEPFYHQNRITDWHKAESVEKMIKANEKILLSMRQELNN
ncbi:MAG: sulfatase-like hydrolase/transferase [Flavobacteriaceae bacterium]|nr:sulfatase-like hydrolase/transferase [Flavobacteriaceae bacterium]